MNLGIKIPVGALMKCVVRKKDTDQVTRETDWFENIVLDTGCTQMFNSASWCNYMRAGSSSVPPEPSQTALISQIGSTSNIVSGQDQSGFIVDDNYVFQKRTWRFGAGVIVGNVAELGMGWSSTGATLWNRALVRDSSGNPTTITVLADEYLEVQTEIRIYIPQGAGIPFNLVDKSDNIISTHTLTLMPRFISVAGGWSSYQIRLAGSSGGTGGVPTQIFSGSITGKSTNPSGSIVAQWGDMTITRSSITRGQRTKILLAPSVATGVDLKTFLLSLSGFGVSSNANALAGFQLEVSPAITKNAEQSLEMDFDLQFVQAT